MSGFIVPSRQRCCVTSTLRRCRCVKGPLIGGGRCTTGSAPIRLWTWLSRSAAINPVPVPFLKPCRQLSTVRMIGSAGCKTKGWCTSKGGCLPSVAPCKVTRWHCGPLTPRASLISTSVTIRSLGLILGHRHEVNTHHLMIVFQCYLCLRTGVTDVSEHLLPISPVHTPPPQGGRGRIF